MFKFKFKMGKKRLDQFRLEMNKTETDPILFGRVVITSTRWNIERNKS